MTKLMDELVEIGVRGLDEAALDKSVTVSLHIQDQTALVTGVLNAVLPVLAQRMVEHKPDAFQARSIQAATLSNTETLKLGWSLGLAEFFVGELDVTAPDASEPPLPEC